MTIRIPQEILDKTNKKGLTIFLNKFWIRKEISTGRLIPENDLIMFSFPKYARIGHKDYNGESITVNLVVPQKELQEIIELLKKT